MNDLIERADALAAIALGDTVNQLQAKIRAIPRTLAPADGLAMLAELRAEIDALKADLTSYMDAANEYMRGEEAAEAQLAATQAKLERVVGAAWWMLIEYVDVDLDHREPPSMTAAATELRAALEGAKP